MVAKDYEELVAEARPWRPDLMSFDENALGELFYTSGTSANPKGVMLTHRNIYMHAMNVAVTFHAGGDSVELHTIPLFHANGWGVAQSLTFIVSKHGVMHPFVNTDVIRLIDLKNVTTP